VDDVFSLSHAAFDVAFVSPRPLQVRWRGTSGGCASAAVPKGLRSPGLAASVQAHLRAAPDSLHVGWMPRGRAAGTSLGGRHGVRPGGDVRQRRVLPEGLTLQPLCVTVQVGRESPS
jgi:hypothetical protein